MANNLDLAPIPVDSKKFTREDVTIYDVVDGSIPAYVDEWKWNGFEVPYFERKEMEKAIVERKIDPQVAQLSFDGDALYLVEMISNHLPEKIDFDRIIEQLPERNGSQMYNLTEQRFEDDEVADEKHICCLVTRYQPHILNLDGEAAVVYPVGAASWTWEKWEPEPAPGL